MLFATLNLFLKRTELSTESYTLWIVNIVLIFFKIALVGNNFNINTQKTNYIGDWKDRTACIRCRTNVGISSTEDLRDAT